MSVFVGVLIVVALAAVIPAAVAVVRDVRRLRAGAAFRESRGRSSDGGFLASYAPEEIVGLQAPRLRWISASLPDPRDHTISELHAQYYWRMAVRRAETSQMMAELGITLFSALLGVLLGVLVTGLFARGSQPTVGDNYLLGAVVLNVLGLAALVSTKVAAGRRWDEAIDLYARLGWPEKSASAPRLLSVVRWFGTRLSR